MINSGVRSSDRPDDAEARLAARIAHAAPIPLVLVTSRGDLEWCNAAFRQRVESVARFSGESSLAELRATFLSQIDPDQREQAERTLRASIQHDGSSSPAEFRFDWSGCPYRAQSSSLAGGLAVIGFVEAAVVGGGVSSDLGPLEHFAGAVAHRLRNQLMVIANSELIAAAGSPEAEVLSSPLFRGLQESIKDSYTLIESFLAFAPGAKASAQTHLPTILRDMERFVAPGFQRTDLDFVLVRGAAGMLEPCPIPTHEIQRNLLALFEALCRGLPMSSRVAVEPVASDRVEIEITAPAAFDFDPSGYDLDLEIERVQPESSDSTAVRLAVSFVAASIRPESTGGV